MKIQQGDVILKKVEVIPENVLKLNHLILAEGETSGHKHKMSGGSVLYAEPETGNVFLDVFENNVMLFHEEHNDIKIHPGFYQIGKVREYDHFEEEARQVQD